jgi:hypothetical protein
MDKRVFGGGLALFALIAAILFVPWATESRTVIASIPVAPPLFGITPAPVGPGKQACMTQVTFDRFSQIGRIGATTGGKPGPAITITASGPGYRATSSIPAGYGDDTGLQFQLTPPQRELIGEICFLNRGPGTLTLNGTNEFRTMGRPSLLIDGVPQLYDVQLSFFARDGASYLSRAGAIFRHAAIFTPDLLPRVVIALIALLALIGIPAGAIAALAIAIRRDEEAAASEPPG